MNIRPCELAGLLRLEPEVFGDARGYFFESWNARRFQAAGITTLFVQDNVSFSRRGTVRGLHVQNPRAQAKLVSVLHGEVFDVVVDLRRSSPTFGRWHGLVLSAENRWQLFIPPGFAHGFAVLSETALFFYKCSDFYAPEHELTVAWNDPDLDIQWPVRAPILSARDQRGLRLKDVPPERLFP